MNETNNINEKKIPKDSVFAEEFADMLVRRGKITKDAEALRDLAARVMNNFENGDAALEVEPISYEEDLLEDNRQDWSTVVGLDEQENWERPVHPLIWVGFHGLVYDSGSGDGLLYLSRCRQAERRIGAFVRECLSHNQIKDFPEPSEEKIMSLTEKLKNENSREQREAVKKCSGKRLAVLTGGPGTGKTTTLGAILLLELQHNPKLSIGLCAPTGKAAAQMRKALQDEMKEDEKKENEKKEVSDTDNKNRVLALQPTTIHKLLGINQYRSGLPRYHHGNPLPYQLVVVDESSMVDLITFSRLIDALPPNGRLLLLGDKDQLDAVETGVVFADLVKFLEENHPDCLQKLKTNFRSKDIKELVEFAHSLSETTTTQSETTTTQIGIFHKDILVHKADIPEKLNDLYATKSDKFWAKTPQKDEKDIKTELATWFELLNLEVPEKKEGESLEVYARAWLDFHERFKVLCTTRHGSLGIYNMNRYMKEILGQTNDENGIPLMNTQNDSILGLKNGDVGVRLGDRVYFRNYDPEEKSDIKAVSYAQLMDHCEEAYAITIHKSQGSSYDNVLVTLPDDPKNPLLTRNLLYTGITRAKKTCLIWATRPSVEKAIETPTNRVSGLARLCHEDPDAATNNTDASAQP
jgi:exodeoxyribonuclease V alpha subunit